MTFIVCYPCSNNNTSPAMATMTSPGIPWRTSLWTMTNWMDIRYDYYDLTTPYNFISTPNKYSLCVCVLYCKYPNANSWNKTNTTEENCPRISTLMKIVPFLCAPPFHKFCNRLISCKPLEIIIYQASVQSHFTFAMCVEECRTLQDYLLVPEPFDNFTI